MLWDVVIQQDGFVPNCTTRIENVNAPSDSLDFFRARV